MEAHEATRKRPRLLDQVCEAMRLKHDSYHTEEAYLGWIIRYVKFHLPKHPADIGPDSIKKFLGKLATEDHVAASTKSQALAAMKRQ